MIKATATIFAAALLTAPAFADEHASGDPDAGEAVFKKCMSCHVIADPDGNVLAGRNAKTGPNLYGIVGTKAGEVEGFRFGKSILAAGEAGLVWDEETFVAYVQDPKAFLREFLDDSKARTKMSFKLRDEQDAKDVFAFIAQFGGDEDGGS